MINTGEPFVMAEDMMDSIGKVARICGGTYLISHDIDALVFGCQTEHCLDKVSAEFRIEPCCADNQGILTERGKDSLPFKLCASVYASRIRLIILLIRTIVFTVENVVGGDMNHFHAMFGGSLRDIPDGYGIDCSRFEIVGFCTIHCRIGSAVDDKIEIIFANEMIHLFAICNVEILNICIDHFKILVIAKCLAQTVAELSVCACHKYSHVISVILSE